MRQNKSLLTSISTPSLVRVVYFTTFSEPRYWWGRVTSAVGEQSMPGIGYADDVTIASLSDYETPSEMF
jgi:hypothetical protein